MTELTENGADMRSSSNTGALQALDQALGWFLSMQVDEFNLLTSAALNDREKVNRTRNLSTFYRMIEIQ